MIYIELHNIEITFQHKIDSSYYTYFKPLSRLLKLGYSKKTLVLLKNLISNHIYLPNYNESEGFCIPERLAIMEEFIHWGQQKIIFSSAAWKT